MMLSVYSNFAATLLKATSIEGDESYSFTLSTHIVHEALGIYASQPPWITFSNRYRIMAPNSTHGMHQYGMCESHLPKLLTIDVIV